MLLLTLNMNMFNFVIDDSFNDYFNFILPDIAFIQECRYNRINKQYHAEWAGNYKEPIDSRIHLSVAISKDENISKSNIDLNDDYTCVFVEYEKYKFAGVHLPLIDKKRENERKREKILSKIKKSDSKIICGDFNACSNNENQEYLEELLNDNYYIDLWQVLEITSICCSRVKSINLTAYPDTRIVKFAYSSFSGCSIASINFSVPNTFTFK